LSLPVEANVQLRERPQNNSKPSTPRGYEVHDFQQNPAFDSIKKVAEPLKAQFDPWMSDLKDLQKYLSNDLTIAGVDVAKGLMAKAKAEGMDVQKSMDALVAELNTVAASLTPAKVEPKGRAAQPEGGRSRAQPLLMVTDTQQPVGLSSMNKRNGPSPPEFTPRGNGRSGRAAATLLLAVTVALSPGCGLLRAPQKVITAVVPAGQSKGPDPLGLQLQLQRFADDYSAQTTAAIDEYVRRVGTDAARIDGMKWKLNATSAAVSIASGAHPQANLLDLVVLTTLTRMTVEDRMATSTNGPAAQLWLDTARVLESNVWTLAATVLNPTQVKELRETIAGWYARSPEARAAFFARPQEFAAMVKTSPQKGADLNSVFSLVSLDPTAGLDPAVREITLTRLFAERAMFTAQRVPYLLRIQIELLTEQLARQPAAQVLLTNTARLSESADRLSRATESFSQTATQLPDRISAERKAILSALDQQEGKLRDLAAEVNRSLTSAEKMSTSLNTTITTFDALMKRFGVGEPRTNAAPRTNSQPFRILDYGTTAAQIGSMAKDLNTLITSVNQSVPQLTQVSQQATADAQRVVHRAFRLGLVLILVLLAGSVLAALAYRILANKLAGAGRPSSSPPPP